MLAQDYKIVILALPPHSIHKLQLLDVGLFAPIAQYYGQELTKHLRDGRINVNKNTFLE